MAKLQLSNIYIAISSSEHLIPSATTGCRDYQIICNGIELNLKQAIDKIDQPWSDYNNKLELLLVNENDEFTNPLTDDDNQQALVHQIKEFIIVIDEPLVTEDTEIVEMVLEDAQIEADTNIDSDEGNEEPH
ncbi:7291_t:CDS:2 [Entrophospora sp. SA101]|nr:7291_t:CDS:2 [Entrophospora sp. SA101]